MKMFKNCVYRENRIKWKRVKRDAKKTSSTKEQILKMLKVQKRLTVGEMAEQLQITEMAVRRHLSALEREELVESTLVRQPMGRPTNVYQLSVKGHQRFPRHYQQTMLDF